MPLNESQIVEGSIVDHQLEIINERSGETRQRDLVRRGMITAVLMNPQTGGKEIYVQFKSQDDAEIVPNAELSLFRMPDVTYKAVKRDEPEVFSERVSEEKKHAKPVIKDDMKLTKKRKPPKVPQKKTPKAKSVEDQIIVTKEKV